VAGSLQDIRLFVAAYEERSFTDAAQRENATQSGVSQHIRKLEEALGIKLFTRDKGQVTPTPAADRYYQRCIEVLRAHDSATRTARAFAQGLEGEVIVGLMPTMTRCALAPSLSHFIEEHPNVTVRVIEGYSGNLTQRVRSGELDFAIVPAFPGLAGLKSRLFLRTPEVLVCREDSSVKPLSPARLAERGPLKLILPSTINTRRRTLETYCASNGAEIARTLELDAMLGTLDLISRSDWVGILPGIMMADDERGNGLSVHPLIAPELWLDLVLIEPSRRPMSAAANAFLARMEQESRRLNARWQAPADAPPPGSRQPPRHSIGRGVDLGAPKP
jgi:LysR family nitrogen assimilation transcriptional regulator